MDKKSSRFDSKNYRPISLLSMIRMVFKRVVAEVVCHHLSNKYILSHQQFGFQLGQSISDMLMVFTRNGQDAIDSSLGNAEVALGRASTFNRVWHGGVSEKLHTKVIQGDILLPLNDYLHERTLSVDRHLNLCKLKYQYHKDLCLGKSCGISLWMTYNSCWQSLLVPMTASSPSPNPNRTVGVLQTS